MNTNASGTRLASWLPGAPGWRISLCLLFSILPAFGLVGLPADRDIGQYVRKAWTVEQGLPHGTVRGFAQTADGYLWLATYEGLVRFNGETFRIFDKASSGGLRNNSIRTILHGRNGTLWIGTVDGLSALRDGKLESVATREDLGDDIVDALAESPDGALWIGTNAAGVSRLIDGRMERLTLALPGDAITAIAASGEDVWIGTTSGLARTRDGSVEIFGREHGLSSETVLTLLASQSGEVWIGTASGLDRLVDGRVERVTSVPSDQVTALLRDRDGNVWVGTYSSGAFRLTGDRVSAYGIGDGLLDPTVRAIFEDDEGSIWLGSNRGMEQLRTGPFVTWDERSGLRDDFARAIFEDRDGILWAGTAGGLSRRNGDLWTPHPDPRLAGAYILAIAQSRDGALWFGTPNGVYRVASGSTRLYTTADGLSSATVRAIHEDTRGDVWLASDVGVNRIRTSGRVESFAGAEGVTSDYAMAIVETGDGHVWFATGGGLAEFDGTSFTLHSAPASLPSNRLFALAADDDGTLWIGTDGDGLIRFRKGSTSVITSAQGLATDKILSLIDDGRGSYWFGTVRGVFPVAKADLHALADGTLFRIAPPLFDEHDGLGSRQCNGSSHPAAMRSRDGSIWFATARGVSALVFDPDAIAASPLREPIVERVVVDGQLATPALLRAIPPGAERIELHYTGATLAAPDRLRFRYRLEGYRANEVETDTARVATYTNLPPGNYRFVLQASRDGMRWKSTALHLTLKPHLWETRTFVVVSIALVLALLLSGHFVRLHLTRKRAALLAELVDQRTLEIRAEKVRTEAALRETEAAKREAERMEEAAERALAEATEANRAKSTFLATTSHELRTPLNAIIGFSGVLLEKPAGDPLSDREIGFLRNIHSSGEYLLGIINNILDLSKIEAGRMEFFPEPVALAEVIEGIRTVMKGVTSLREITFETEVDDGLPQIDADPTQLKQILYNLMANGAKFSREKSRVKVEARPLDAAASPLAEDSVEIRVIDEGIGIDAKDHSLIFQEFRQASGSQGRRPEGTGLGLALVKRFVDMHRGSVRVESEPGRGSTFIVVLPVRQGGRASAEC